MKIKKNTILSITLILCLFFLYFATNQYNLIRTEVSAGIFNYKSEKKIVLAFRNDDLSFGSDIEHEKKVLDIFWGYGIKQTFAFIPKRTNYQAVQITSNENLVIETLKKWEHEGKIDLALHGYLHQKSPGTIGEFAGLDPDEQYRRIKDGKSIIDRTFQTSVVIFSPPWNQADSNTLQACKNAKISIFSGALGIDPIEDLTFVNSNATLFDDFQYNIVLSLRKIPRLETILEFAKNTNGTVFIIVFYHSRTDFGQIENFHYLDSFLKKVTQNPTIEISTIKQIATNYHRLLPAYNAAGLQIKKIHHALNVAKPYVLIGNMVQNLFNQTLEVEKLYNLAIDNYWTGNYKKSETSASNVIKKCNSYITYGRLTFMALTILFFLIFSLLYPIKRNNKSVRLIYSWVIIIALAPLLIGIYINLFRPISKVRISELNCLIAIFFLLL